ncbi:MAG: aldehyde dehydrogenase family protein [Hyphomonadaceae bacterium]|nr:aldehyde dehydrogenase family protein [Hyphomonadaceae bacterium]
MTSPPPALAQATQAFLSSDHGLLIGGARQTGQAGSTFETFDPATGQVIARVAEGRAEDVDLAVKAARKAFEGGWAGTMPIEREKLMWRLAELIEAHGDTLAELETLNNGMPLFLSKFSVSSAADMLRYMAGWASKMAGETLNPSTPGEWHAFTLREPVGVVGAIIPWNAPLNMAVWKLAPALATGCTIILKPAEQTPLTALFLGQLVQEAGFPEGVVNIITGFGETAGAALAQHPDVDKIAFTGSTGTGKKIAQYATGNMKRVSLELGGKSPMIVFPDAPLEKAIPGLTMGAFVNSGQVCAAGTRLFVHASIFDQVMESVAAQASKFKLGHGLDPQTTLGPLVSRQQHDRVADFVRSGLADGCAAYMGASSPDSAGYFYEPTLLVNTARDMRVVREEIFGPVLCATPFEDEDLSAIAQLANDTEYGLAASIWTQNISIAHKLSKMIKAGSVGVNTHILNDAVMPFGGFKQSGWGREKGREVLDLYTQIKSVAVSL